MKLSQPMILVGITLLLCITTCGAWPKTKVADAGKMNCLPIVKGWIAFDLVELSDSDNNYKIDLDVNNQIVWNLCNFTTEKCQDKNAYAVLWTTDPDTKVRTCKHLTNDKPIDNITYALQNADVPKNGINIIFSEGDVFDEKSKLSFNLSLDCDPTSTDATLVKAGSTGAQFSAEYKTKQGCPKVNPNELWEIFTRNRWLFAIVCVILGSLLTFIGYKLSKFAFFLLGFIISFVPVMYLFFAFAGAEASDGEKWAVFAIATILGFLVGFISVRLEKVGYFILGFGLAYAISNIIFITFLKTMDNGTYILVGMIILGGIILGLLTASYKDAILIVATSLFGGYLIARPVFQLFKPDLPSEWDIAKMLQLGQLDSVPIEIYAYLATWLIIAITGMYLQISKKREEARKNDAVPDYVAI